jgi:hypothetical protein
MLIFSLFMVPLGHINWEALNYLAANPHLIASLTSHAFGELGMVIVIKPRQLLTYA